jgi:pyridoxal phosphate-dependent aminotransferase EpsN
MQENNRIYLSPPHLTGEELRYVSEAFDSNWIAPVGPHVDAFETEFSQYLGIPYSAAVSSGTAALHLAMRLIGIQPGDEVICPTLSFCSTANAVVYQRGSPIFIDSERKSWNIDPNLLAEELAERARRNKLPKVVVTVDLYGQCADYTRILDICSNYDLPIIEDAAEALGATCGDRKAGTLGRIGIFSFNGNKIITTSGGGMLVSRDQSLVEQARYLAGQARDPAPHYQHSTIGYNYRLSNILAAIGRAQLKVLPQRVEARRKVFELYQKHLSVPGIDFMPEAQYGSSTRWLTSIIIDPQVFGADREEVRLALESHNIEARPVWKPLHMQPVFADCKIRGGQVAEEIFNRGLCLPSGSNLSACDSERICEIILNTRK